LEAITNAMVRGLRPRGRVYEVTCGRLAGFAVRVLPTGKKVFLVRHRRGGHDSRVRIGQWGPELSAEQARLQAMAILAGGPPAGRDDEEDEPAKPSMIASVAAGVAPRSAQARSPKRAANEPLEPYPSQITVRDVAERFLREHAGPHLKPGTALNYRRCLEQIILPALGDRAFDSITRSDVKALYAKNLERRSAADCMICVIGSLYTRVIDDWEMADMRNPTAGIKRRKSRMVERFLSPEERRRVVAEIQAALKIPPTNKGHIEPVSAWALMLLMLTGHRRNEILTLTWEMIDWQHACLNYPDTKTGQRTARVSSEVMTLLREIHDKAGNPRFGFVLRGRNGGRLTRINDTWERIRTAVGLPDVRLHDLRHSFASDALMAGVPLAIVGEMLGHKQPMTTKRYAHLSDQSVRSALETTAKRITDAWRDAPAPASEAPFVPLTDRQWSRIAPLVVAEKARGGPPVDLRGIVDGIRWVQQRKARWREVPARFGTPTTCWRWFSKWSESGVWGEIAGIVGAVGAGL
jgi:integrase